ncbi:MAG: hypothetical protein Q8P21_00040, partial [bacterium]|nr:hypothetical protein [bacterium]
LIQELFPDWHPHATLANFLNPEEFESIWNYVLTLPKPNFSIPFNNITLFRSTDNEGWEIQDCFPIK